jgi:DNA-binding FadR family transcriptional regulator
MSTSAVSAEPGSSAGNQFRAAGAGVARSEAKLAAQVARRIEDDVIAAGWPVGHVLGSELDLRDRYGVSRAVLREAVRLVEHHSVAVMRRGPSGGLVIREPSAEPASVAMAVYLEYAGTTVDDLLHARMVLEPMAAALAAEHITEEGVEELRETLRIEATHNATQLASPASDLLHAKIAQLCGNAPLATFIGVLLTLTTRYAAAPNRVVGGVRAVAKEVTQAHGSVVEAIIAGDRSLAEHRTVRHLEGMRRWLKDHDAGPPRGLAAVVGLDRTAVVKLAEVLAARIYDDIATGDRRVGEVIGSESELLERYGVSRAVLREAVRLLEHHSIARMRRGPGGGLVLTSPHPQASVEAMAVYLEYGGIDVQHLHVARDAVELACLDLLTPRSADPEMRSALLAALDREERMVHVSRDEVTPIANDFHADLSDLAGNPVLALFSHVLTALSERHTPPDQPLVAADVSTVNTAHRAIVEAVLAGDAALARRRMRRHLDALTSWWR